MNVNPTTIGIVIVLILVLLFFLIRKNKKDEKKFEDQENGPVNPDKHEEPGI